MEVEYRPSIQFWYQIRWKEVDARGRLSTRRSYHLFLTEAKEIADLLFIQPGVRNVMVTRQGPSNE